MTTQPDRAELVVAYEALRAQATGVLPTVMPRGLALFLAAGSPVWMKALKPTSPTPRVVRSEQPVSSAVASDVVRVLTEMALGCQRRWATS